MKINFKVILLTLIVFTVSSSGESLISGYISSVRNLWPKSKDLSNDQELKKVPAIQFELPVENEEFIKKGLEIIGSPRSSLDLCNHRVVQTLKKNCNQLNSEEIGKLAVMLLNCQLEVEGRSTFPCRPEMTLQQCTTRMNSEMYQAYSYMSHRAVQICSALKHDQFRAMSEITVNQLMQAAQAQVNAMNEALKNQKRINKMETENINQISENDLKIKEAQIVSLEKMKYAGSLIDENLMNLQKELELRQITEETMNEIGKSADEISSKFNHHKSELHQGHEKLLEDVDEISANLQKNKEELSEQYNQTLEFLNQFKSVMLVLSNIAVSMKSHSDKILQSLQQIGFELTGEFIVFMAINICYFLCGMVFMLFIGVTGYCKLLLIGLIVFNSIASYFKVETPLFGMNIFVWMCFLAWKLLTFIKRQMEAANVLKYLQFRKKLSSDESDGDDENTRRSLTPLRPPTPKDIKISPKEITLRKRLHNGADASFLSAMSQLDDSIDEAEMSAIFNSQIKKTASSSLPNRPDTPSTLNRSDTPSRFDRPMTPAMRRVLSEAIPQALSPNRSGTPFLPGMSGRIQCLALTAKGLRCKNAAVVGTTNCRVHKFN